MSFTLNRSTCESFEAIFLRLCLRSSKQKCLVYSQKMVSLVQADACVGCESQQRQQRRCNRISSSNSSSNKRRRRRRQQEEEERRKRSSGGSLRAYHSTKVNFAARLHYCRNHYCFWLSTSVNTPLLRDHCSNLFPVLL